MSSANISSYEINRCIWIVSTFCLVPLELKWRDPSDQIIIHNTLFNIHAWRDQLCSACFKGSHNNLVLNIKQIIMHTFSLNLYSRSKSFWNISIDFSVSHCSETSIIHTHSSTVKYNFHRKGYLYHFNYETSSAILSRAVPLLTISLEGYDSASDGIDSMYWWFCFTSGPLISMPMVKPVLVSVLLKIYLKRTHYHWP